MPTLSSTWAPWGLTAAGGIRSGRCIREPHASRGHSIDPALLEWKAPECQSPARSPAQPLLGVEGKGWLWTQVCVQAWPITGGVIPGKSHLSLLFLTPKVS